jgi:hypothetical protein
MSLRGQKTTTSSMDWDDFKSLISKLERDEEYIAKLAELANKVILIRDEYLNKLEGK